MARAPEPMVLDDQRIAIKKIISLVSERTGYNEYSVGNVIKEFHSVICDSIEEGKRIINIRPYYKIEVMFRAERNMVNVVTGEKRILPEANYLRLTPLMNLKRACGYDNKYMRNNQAAIEKAFAIREKKRLEKLSNLRKRNLGTDTLD